MKRDTSRAAGIRRRNLLGIGACGLVTTLSGSLRDHEHNSGSEGASNLPDGGRPDKALTSDPTFSDHFTDEELNEERWQTKFPWDARIHNFDAYVAPENAYVADDLLVLEGEDQPREGLSYTTGAVSTRRSFVYGYFEASIQIPPTAPGFWPAFWLTPTEPEVIFPEIDIFEFFGADPCAVLTYHYQDEDGEDQERNDQYCGERFSRGFHTYAVDWNSDRIIWYIDGEEYFRYDGPHVADLEMSLVLNFGIGADFLDEPQQDYLPASMLIDRVDVWQ